MERLSRRDFIIKIGRGPVVGLALTAGVVALAPVIEGGQLPIRNPVVQRERYEYDLRYHPGSRFLLSGVISPFLQELIFFRQIPDLFLRFLPQVKEKQLGIFLSSLFALAHLREDPRKIPLPEFVAGMTFWKLQRKYGFWTALCAHSTTNSSLITLGKLTLKT